MEFWNLRSYTVDLEPESCEKGAGNPQIEWTRDIRVAGSTWITESQDFIGQMVGQAQEGTALSKVTQQVA